MFFKGKMDAFISVLLPEALCLLKSMIKNVNNFLIFPEGQVFILNK